MEEEVRVARRRRVNGQQMQAIEAAAGRQAIDFGLTGSSQDKKALPA